MVIMSEKIKKYHVRINLCRTAEGAYIRRHISDVVFAENADAAIAFAKVRNGHRLRNNERVIGTMTHRVD